MHMTKHCVVTPYMRNTSCDFPSRPVVGYLERKITKNVKSDAYAQEAETAASSVGPKYEPDTLEPVRLHRFRN
jgi:hypothetical protein